MKWFWRMVMLAGVLTIIIKIADVGKVQSEQQLLTGLALMETNLDGQIVRYGYVGDQTMQSIVYLPGLGGPYDRVVYEEYQSIKELSQNYQVYILDFPGFRRSRPPDRVFNMVDYSRLLGEFLVKMKLEKPVIISQPLWAKVVFDLALTHSEDVGLIVVSDWSMPWLKNLLGTTVERELLGKYYKNSINDDTPAGLMTYQLKYSLAVPETDEITNLDKYRSMGKIIDQLLSTKIEHEPLMNKVTSNIVMWESDGDSSSGYQDVALDYLFPNSVISRCPAGEGQILSHPNVLFQCIRDYRN